MEFNPQNPVVQLCVQAMSLQEQGRTSESGRLFDQAWKEASNALEKFIAAFCLAKHQHLIEKRLEWLKVSASLASKTDTNLARSALPALELEIAECYERLSDTENSRRHRELAAGLDDRPADAGPFYHGTRADLKTGELLVPGGMSNYESGTVMNHIYFTAIVSGAGLAAALAKGDAPERIYIVEPTGAFENDPNVTNKKFPGNPTRSYRSLQPLKIVGELGDWNKLKPEEISQWREKLRNNRGEIIN